MRGELLEARRVGAIVGAFYDVYNYFGPGLFESTYLRALQVELTARGHEVVRELSVAVYYKNEHIGWQRLDMVVDGAVVVEGKANDQLPRNAGRQVVSYLRLSPYKVGLLLHFGPEEARFWRFVDSRKRHPR